LESQAEAEAARCKTRDAAFVYRLESQAEAEAAR